MTTVLGIETSCDETGVAVVSGGREVRSNLVASQVAIHAPYGGVVPEIASRQHLACIVQLTEQALAEAGVAQTDAVAATCAPGLQGSLLVGVNFGKALALAWGTPFVPVHHLEGHVYSVFLTESPPEFPFLALIVSGGHTTLLWCPGPHRYEQLGATRDDAVGECFDKVARLLGLPYPGGPSIQRAAEAGDPHAIAFPRGLSRDDSLDFSYSGLKTAVLYLLRGNGGESVADIAASFQYAAVDVLVSKTKLALAQTGARRLVLAGGVAANRLLRNRLEQELDAAVFMPAFALCLDNGAMIAAAGYSRFAHGFRGGMRSSALSTLPITEADRLCA